MNILVTGGTGFIGSAIARQLIEHGNNVYVTGHSAESVPEKAKFLPHGPIGINWNGLERSIKQNPGSGSLDVVFHQAANNDTTWEDDSEMEFSNVTSSLFVFDKSVDLGCKKFIYASSTAVYGNTATPHNEDGAVDPLNAYARSKLQLERASRIFAENRQVVCIGLRYCNVYGPGESPKGKRASMICQIAKQIPHKPIKLFGDGNEKRDYVYIDDVVRANLLAMETNHTCVVNIGSGASTTFNRLYELIATRLKKTSWGKPTYIDNPYKGKYQNNTECNMHLASELLGFVPKYDIEAGLDKYLKPGEL